jgi:hypothetical protein
MWPGGTRAEGGGGGTGGEGGRVVKGDRDTVLQVLIL